MGDIGENAQMDRTANARIAITDDERKELLEIVKQVSFRSGQFTLASGRQSNLYFNMKPTMMDARGAALSAKALLQIMQQTGAEYVSGLEMGAVPAIGAMAAISDLLGTPIKTSFVRKRQKEHGTKQLIEGLKPDESLEGKKVLVIDDVATSGGSILQAIKEVRNAGAIVEHAAALVDRREGGSELMTENGVQLHHVLTAGDFLD